MPWLVLLRSQSDGPLEDQLLPTVSVATSAAVERLREWVRAEGHWHAGWDVSEWEQPDLPWTLSDAARRAISAAAEVLSPTDVSAVEAILDRVAGRLATDAYVGSDVVVAACDFNLERLEAGLRSATPASRLERLRGLGLY